MGTWAKPLFRSLDKDVYRHLMEIPLLAFSLIPQKKEKMSSRSVDSSTPVIFVHGMGGNRAHFLPMEIYFKLCGIKNTYRVDLSGADSVKRMAWRLSVYVQKVMRASGSSQVDIVAHSLGGIVSRIAIENYGLGSNVRTLITLGTPHQGTYSARFADTKASNELRPGSVLVKRLQKMGWPKGVRGVNFWSRNDVVILPAESALVEGLEQIDFSPSTHFGYLCRPTSWETVYNVLFQSDWGRLKKNVEP
jgi:triacylglycerol lipase